MSWEEYDIKLSNLVMARTLGIISLDEMLAGLDTLSKDVCFASALNHLIATDK